MEKHQNYAQDTAGNVVNGASVSVTNADTGATATLYEDDETTVLGQPLTTGANDSLGEFAFKAANGNYTVTVTNGGSSRSYPVTLFDPDDEGDLIRHGTASGTDTITTTLSPAPASYTDGLTAIVEAAGANTTTTPTLNVNSLGAKTLVKEHDQALEAGDISGAGFPMHVRFDTGLGASGKWVLLNPAKPSALSDKADKTAIQVGSYTSAADGSASANTLTATLSPAPSAYAQWMRATVEVANTTTGAATLNLNSLGAKSIKLLDGTDPYSGAMRAGGIYEFVYDGTNFVLQNPTPKSVANPITGAFRNLTAANNSTNPNYQVDIAADELVVKDSSGRAALLENVAVTVDITASGANGLDTGTEAADTWYYLWVIYDGTTVAGLLSTSSTAPTLPSGYTYKALVGAVRNDGSSNFKGFKQRDGLWLYTGGQTIANGGFSTGAWTSIPMTSFFPSISKEVRVFMGSAFGRMGLSPFSDGFGGAYANFYTGGTSTLGGVMSQTQENQATFDVRYEATMYYYVDNADSTMMAVGCRL